MPNSLISIIVPTYNRAHLIGETIESIQQQTYKNWECIIIDDGSTDNTEDVVRNYLEIDKRIQYYKKPKDRPKGPSAARNYGFQKCKGTHINFFDSDDIMHPQKLEIDLKNVQSGDFDFTVSQSQFFGKTDNYDRLYWNNTLYSNQPLDDFILKKIGWCVNSPLWKKQSLEKCNLCFDESLITADDYFFHIEALSKGLNPHINKEVLVMIRVHENRLENFKNKSPFKLKVVHNLLVDRSLILNKITIARLLKMSLKQIGNSFKHKNYSLGVMYVGKFLILNQSIKFKSRLLKLLFYGTFYKMFGLGYSYLDVGFKDLQLN